jgi:hypothetical protein
MDEGEDGGFFLFKEQGGHQQETPLRLGFRENNRPNIEF